ncbi:molecular chaperone [Uliginosibacterium sp. sgz301328]|uniref:fimbrial biogenesis chaperone n=1 Tax=Uliginosibacterium sp. sgz301328 TaxID=3243764 RepID=UPI00359D5996
MMTGVLRTLLRTAIAAVSAGVFASGPAGAAAGLFVEGSRHIYPAGAQQISVQVHNPNDHAVMLQSWIDAGDVDGDPDDAGVPFIVVPPVTRLQPGETRALRIIGTAESLPEGRESVFWLNLQMIPPVEEATGSDVLTVSVRQRQKLFYRPKGLEQGSKAWIGQLRCVVEPGAPASAACRNDSPYNATIDRLQVDTANGVATVPGAMLPPFSSQSFALPEGARAVHAFVIDDRGAVVQASPR